MWKEKLSKLQIMRKMMKNLSQFKIFCVVRVCVEERKNAEIRSFSIVL